MSARAMKLSVDLRQFSRSRQFKKSEGDFCDLAYDR